VVTEAARSSAYAELITGLLEVRDTSSEMQFDAALAAAESADRIDSDTARLLRWWQRETVRAVVDHAQLVLPATLLALEDSFREAHQRTAPPIDQPISPTSAAPTTEAAAEPEWADDHPPPTDLSARRLLVAGLTPLRDP
jgi:hypothetical protein